MNCVNVDLGERSYPIHIGDGVMENQTLTSALLCHPEIVVVTNTTIASLYLDKFLKSIESPKSSTVVLPDGEKYKTLDTANLVFTHLLENRCSRKVRLVALGGGVIGDITGYVAACYQRGVEYVQVPTTLLAQVDSSVGGKTGVNHPLGKNMIGAFHQPRAVYADTTTLSTLPQREYSAGLAEVIKYGLIWDSEFYQWLLLNAGELVQKKSEAIAHVIQRCCEIKAAVVAEDEREAGIRAILNLGHTFGHGIENCLGYGEWLHGEAVAAGMVMALDMSIRQGHIDAKELEVLTGLLEVFKLPVRPPQLDVQRFVKAMSLDKKNQSGRIHLVLLEETGKAVVTADYKNELLMQIINDYLF